MIANKIIKTLKKYRVSEDISIDEINKIITANKDVILLDVRSMQEYNEGHLKRGNKYTTI